MYGKYRGLRAVLFTRVSTGSQSHDAQERVIREMLIELLGLQLGQLPLAKAQGLVPHSARVETIGWLTEQPASKDVSMLAR
jgi:hypothetical protein